MRVSREVSGIARSPGMWVALIVLSLNAAVSPGAAVKAWAGEPTEQEMQAAIEAVYEAKNAEFRSVKQQCQDRQAIRNNPILAMQCLTVYGGSGGSGDLQYNLTYFKKIACEKSSGSPGYVCDYVASQSSTGAYSTTIDSYTQEMLGQGRFVNSGGRWIFLPITK